MKARGFGFIYVPGLSENVFIHLRRLLQESLSAGLPVLADTLES